jgi:hypothetical protein
MYKMKKLPAGMQLIITSPPMYEKLVAELYFNGELWAFISHDEDYPLLEIYPKRVGTAWVFKLEDAIEALQIAKDQLLED